ncbi:Abi-alpha family protein [Thiothrix nivea]|uniref:DUF4393 domain-containing protein n=1 Tax=Thiothrix nivea (strain ATCC 35100 / DSM 5205 / JP2) TaxID=870187 RepID=A0A656HJA1_THINJ|nr:Abi-alpha family protein [Thiothrix nivea]EIJ36998.1 hypothetical protein Thini_4527 [Thiothrix nivea DSM 5205]
MSDDKKIDVSSTTIEKGIDVAKSFVDKLVSPSIEELGLLVKDQISLWRFNNQIKILNKAKSICEKNQINVTAIPAKLLCPYLENASLEDDNELQDKWAILLVNMVDSKQNIQNHVFPYILSQLSKDEFNLLESVLIEKKRRTSELEKELASFCKDKENIENNLKSELLDLEKNLKELSPNGKYAYSKESMELRSSIRSISGELQSIKFKESRLKRKIATPEVIPEQNLKEFEMANIIRLGLAKVVYESNAGTHSIDIPAGDRDSYTSV